MKKMKLCATCIRIHPSIRKMFLSTAKFARRTTKQPRNKRIQPPIPEGVACTKDNRLKPIKRVKFSNTVVVSLIPTINEYKQEGLSELVWTSETELKLNQMKLVEDVLTSPKYNARNDFKTNLLLFDTNEEELINKNEVNLI